MGLRKPEFPVGRQWCLFCGCPNRHDADRHHDGPDIEQTNSCLQSTVAVAAQDSVHAEAESCQRVDGSERESNCGCENGPSHTFLRQWVAGANAIMRPS